MVSRNTLEGDIVSHIMKLFGRNGIIDLQLVDHPNLPSLEGLSSPSLLLGKMIGTIRYTLYKI